MNVEQVAATARQQQARALLDGLHATQFGSLPESLLASARSSALGRRMLARTMSRRLPDLFAPDQERWQSWQNSEGWLQWPQSRLESFTRTLGAMALGPALRMIVERSTVLFVRDVLGQDHWRQAQLAAPWKGAPPETIRLMGATVLRRCGNDAEALTTAIFERGQIEFIGHAERRHPELATRLALGYAQAPATPCSKETWLPLNTVADLLAAEAATDALLLQAKFTPLEEDPPP
ncbi:hypothetical protein ACPPVV_08070 [Rhodanobacter sp. Col0626]|uniref:hypothetical protein n=1 Tax=Rhodanobacter sp. Col0626 TaxID=3415679 RepID=UPI003CE764DB